MNKWECNFPGCDVIAIGSGGAVGLRAIGWFFQLGSLRPLRAAVILCPAHNVDVAAIECRMHPGSPCRSCAVEAAAMRIQAAIYTKQEKASGLTPAFVAYKTCPQCSALYDAVPGVDYCLTCSGFGAGGRVALRDATLDEIVNFERLNPPMGVKVDG